MTETNVDSAAAADPAQTSTREEVMRKLEEVRQSSPLTFLLVNDMEDNVLIEAMGLTNDQFRAFQKEQFEIFMESLKDGIEQGQPAPFNMIETVAGLVGSCVEAGWRLRNDQLLERIAHGADLVAVRKELEANELTLDIATDAYLASREEGDEQEGKT